MADSSISSKRLARMKMKMFETGNVRRNRNPFEEHRVQMEAKRKREEMEIAQAYESFSASFEEESSDPNKQKFVKAGGPAPPKPASSTHKTNIFAQQPARVHAVQKGRKKNIDLFLEELKRDAGRQPTEFRRPQRSQEEPGRAGSHDIGDAMTTNLYVGNLSPSVTETMLLLEFGKFGPVGSVKIMWPRTQEEMTRKRNCGFVSFMDRPSAAACLRELQGYEIHGQPLRLGWGKAVALPPRALPMPTSASIAESKRPAPELAFSIPSDACKIRVPIPSDANLRRLIDVTASFTARNGAAFESEIMKAEADNPLYSFLFDRSSEPHLFYRWRTYSLSSGDSLDSWRTSPFQMVQGGPFWLPPHVPANGEFGVDITQTCEAEATRINRDFVELLQCLSFERERIMEAMGFAMDNAEHSSQLTDIIDQFMETTALEAAAGKKKAPLAAANSKVAVLYLVSDILHNSSAATVKNAWSYRSEFQERLPRMFKSLHDAYAAIGGRFTAETLKDKVIKVLRVWHLWSLYPSEYLEALENDFLGVAPTPEQPQARDDEDSDDIDGVPLLILADDDDDSDGAASLSGDVGEQEDESEDDDIDGQPLLQA